MQPDQRLACGPGSVAPRFSQILNVVSHAVCIQHALNEQQSLNELANRVLLFLTPGDSRVSNTALVQRQIVRIERNNDPLLGRCKRQLVNVSRPATPGLLRRQHVYAVPAQPLTDRTRIVLIAS